MILSWNPDIIAAGHSSFFYFNQSKFEKIIEWAKRAEKAITSICPYNDTETQYYSLGVFSNKNITTKPDIRLLRDESYGW